MSITKIPREEKTKLSLTGSGNLPLGYILPKPSSVCSWAQFSEPGPARPAGLNNESLSQFAFAGDLSPAEHSDAASTARKRGSRYAPLKDASPDEITDGLPSMRL